MIGLNLGQSGSLFAWAGPRPFLGKEKKQEPVRAGAEQGSSAKASPGVSQGQQELLTFPREGALGFSPARRPLLICSCSLQTGIAVLRQRRGRLCKAAQSPSMLQRASDSIQLLTGQKKKKKDWM